MKTQLPSRQHLVLVARDINHFCESRNLTDLFSRIKLNSKSSIVYANIEKFICEFMLADNLYQSMTEHGYNLLAIARNNFTQVFFDLRHDSYKGISNYYADFNEGIMKDIYPIYYREIIKVKSANNGIVKLVNSLNSTSYYIVDLSTSSVIDEYDEEVNCNTFKPWLSSMLIDKASEYVKQSKHKLTEEKVSNVIASICSEINSDNVNNTVTRELLLASTNNSKVYDRVKRIVRNFKLGVDKTEFWLECKFLSLAKYSIDLYLKDYCSANDTRDSLCNNDELLALQLELFNYYKEKSQGLFDY